MANHLTPPTVGVVGSSAIAEDHLRVAASQGVKVEFITANSNSQRLRVLASQYKCDIGLGFSATRELLEQSSPDILVLATPPRVTSQYMTLLSRCEWNGLILAEKPGLIDAADFQRVMNLNLRQELKFAYNRRFYPSVVSFIESMPTNLSLVDVAIGEFPDEESGFDWRSAILTNSVHILDILLAVCPELADAAPVVQGTDAENVISVQYVVNGAIFRLLWTFGLPTLSFISAYGDTSLARLKPIENLRRFDGVAITTDLKTGLGRRYSLREASEPISSLNPNFKPGFYEMWKHVLEHRVTKSGASNSLPSLAEAATVLSFAESIVKAIESQRFLNT